MWGKLKAWWEQGFGGQKEHTKAVINFLMANAVIWVYLSYVLAFLGREEIAETLSKTVVAEIIGVFMVAGCKACIENLSKNNTWPDKAGQGDSCLGQGGKDEGNI